MRENATRLFAEFISELDYEKLPLKTKNKAKELLLDYIGALLAGYKESSILSDKLVELIKYNGGVEDATIIGTNTRVPLVNAALANGVVSHVVELDDGHRIARGHPGVSVMSAALPTAEFLDSSGKELITAIVAGYEIFIRVASAVNPSHLNRGYHTTGTCGTLAAAAAASSLFKLDELQTANALGIAGTQAAGLLEVTVDGQMTKALHSGKAAYAGVLSALLAKDGVQGPKSIIEGVKGFAKTLSDECDYTIMLNDLGKIYNIDNCYIKLYPSCRHTHSPIDAALDLIKGNEFKYEDIDEIVIKTFPTAISFAGKIYKPDSPEAAKFSIAYCVCAALIKGSFGLGELEKDCLVDPSIISLTNKVKIESDPSLESVNPKTKGAVVTLTFIDGGILNKRINLPKGEVENPVDDDELIEKFFNCTKHYLRKEDRERVINCVLNIEELHNIKSLISLLAGSQ